MEKYPWGCTDNNIVFCKGEMCTYTSLTLTDFRLIFEVILRTDCATKINWGMNFTVSVRTGISQGICTYLSHLSISNIIQKCVEGEVKVEVALYQRATVNWLGACWQFWPLGGTTEERLLTKPLAFTIASGQVIQIFYQRKLCSPHSDCDKEHHINEVEIDWCTDAIFSWGMWRYRVVECTISSSISWIFNMECLRQRG